MSRGKSLPSGPGTGSTLYVKGKFASQRLLTLITNVQLSLSRIVLLGGPGQAVKLVVRPCHQEEHQYLKGYE